MGKVYTGASMSLDGFIAGYDGSGFDQLFQWYGNGDVSVPTADPGMTSRSRRTAPRTGPRSATGPACSSSAGGCSTSRRAGTATTRSGCRSWSSPTPRPRTGPTPTRRSRSSRAASRRRSRRRRRSRATRSSASTPATIASQCAAAGLLDEVWVDLVPVFLGGGVPYVRTLGDGPLVLDGPLEHTQGNRVTHLRYAVRK